MVDPIAKALLFQRVYFFFRSSAARVNPRVSGAFRQARVCSRVPSLGPRHFEFTFVEKHVLGYPIEEAV